MFSSLGLRSDKESTVVMTKDASTKILNLITPRAGILVLGPGNNEHAIFLLLFLSTLGNG